jgi:hypothetical protein
MTVWLKYHHRRCQLESVIDFETVIDEKVDDALTVSVGDRHRRTVFEPHRHRACSPVVDDGLQ